jgi:HD-GYP domain-containing protein (c-di-GMP phosphodiesterase class II)
MPPLVDSLRSRWTRWPRHAEPTNGARNPAPPPTSDPSAANALITIVACVTSVVMAVTVPQSWHLATARWGTFLIFVVVTFGLQLASVPVYDRGAFSFAGSGMLATGFIFGAGSAMTVAALMGVVNLIRRRGRINRGIYDASQWALATAAGTATYEAFGAHAIAGRFAGAVLACCAFLVVNIGLLTAAMSIAESRSPIEIFRARFQWALPYDLISGPLALALVVAYEKTGAIGLLAFAAPPAFMMLSVQQYLAKTRASAQDVQRANDELRLAIGQLEERNADLKELLEFAAGLAARAHNRATLVGYAREALRRVAGSPVDVTDDPEGPIPLVAGGARVGSITLAEPERAGERWSRPREVMLPHLATAMESSQLGDEVRRKHLATIAALSRSMEAKDYYTGGHTERVAEIAVALARRFGYQGEELDAIEIGALLHDIGKIGIPERILHKPGPLDEEEWRLMREHPVISDYILSEIDLHPFVRQIARSSHERIDGAGYPDRMKGDQIPMPARIVLVADALDALTTDRPYRRARPLSAALDELRAHSGTQFCPTVVAAVEGLWQDEPEVLGVGRLHAVEAIA